jgi:hypothetical protein
MKNIRLDAFTIIVQTNINFDLRCQHITSTDIWMKRDQ